VCSFNAGEIIFEQDTIGSTMVSFLIPLPLAAAASDRYSTTLAVASSLGLQCCFRGGAAAAAAALPLSEYVNTESMTHAVVFDLILLLLFMES